MNFRLYDMFPNQGNMKEPIPLFQVKMSNIIDPNINARLQAKSFEVVVKILTPTSPLRVKGPTRKY
jgi:hypothetical protein